MSRSILDWAPRGACRDRDLVPDADLFFASENENRGEASARINAAKAVCKTACPVRDECLAWALATPERDGVWGGMSGRERALLAGAGS